VLRLRRFAATKDCDFAANAIRSPAATRSDAHTSERSPARAFGGVFTAMNAGRAAQLLVTAIVVSFAGAASGSFEVARALP